MNVSLTPELEQLIHKKVETGMYLSAGEVVREALRLLEDRDKLQAMKFEEVRLGGRFKSASGRQTAGRSHHLTFRGRLRRSAAAEGTAMEEADGPSYSLRAGSARLGANLLPPLSLSCVRMS